MHSRYRNPRDGFRPSSSAPSGGRIPSGDRISPHSFPRKHEILMEAGRLAAEFLISRGIIDLSSRKFPNGSPPGFDRQTREIRTSALARLGERRERTRKRSAPPYSKNCAEKGRSYSDLAEEDCEVRSNRYVEIKSVVSADEQPTSLSTAKNDQPPEADEGSSKAVDEFVMEEAKGEKNDEVEKNDTMEEDEVAVNDCKDLLKLCSFTKVPTRPRSSLANKSPKVCRGSDAGMSDAGEEDNHSHQSDKSMENSAHSRGTPDDDDDDDDDASKKKDNSCPSQDQAMVQETNAFAPKDERESDVILEEEIIQAETPSSFKICDLNLTGSPELSEIHGGGTSSDNPAASRNEMNKGVSEDLSVSMRKAVNACDNNNSQISETSKVIPVIDLEEGSHAEDNTFDSPKDKVDISYPGLETVLNQETHTDDLPSIQDGYSLEFSEFLGTDISGCPTGQGDLNDIQPGMGLHGAEGYPGVDDHIYVSLDELPIGFMGVWDPPSQDYGKFF